MSFGGGGGGSGSISASTDVALSNPTNTQVLAYNSTLGKWQNQNPVVSGAQALAAVAAKTGAYTAGVGDLVPADASGGAITITLPTAPADKSRVVVKKIDSSVNAVNVATGGSDVYNKTGGSTSVSLILTNQSLNLQYASSGAIWYVVSQDTPLSQLDARFTTPAAVTTSLHNTDAVIFWDGVTACPLRATGTADTTRRVRWVGPTSPLTTAGYALTGDVWEATS